MRLLRGERPLPRALVMRLLALAALTTAVLMLVFGVRAFLG